MAVMSIRDAINRTIYEEMERDENVIALGEDIVGGMGTAGGPEAIGGIWGATGGLYAKFGPGRVLDTPQHFRICLTATDAMIERALPAFQDAAARLAAA